MTEELESQIEVNVRLHKTLDAAQQDYRDLLEEKEKLEETISSLLDEKWSLKGQLSSANSQKFIRDSEVQRMFNKILSHLEPEYITEVVEILKKVLGIDALVIDALNQDAEAQANPGQVHSNTARTELNLIKGQVRELIDRLSPKDQDK